MKKKKNKKEIVYEKNSLQSMISSETARELVWQWDETVHKYVVSDDLILEDKKNEKKP